MRVLAIEILLLYCFGESRESQDADGTFISLHQLIKKNGKFQV